MHNKAPTMPWMRLQMHNKLLMTQWLLQWLLPTTLLLLLLLLKLPNKPPMMPLPLPKKHNQPAITPPTTTWQELQKLQTKPVTSLKPLLLPSRTCQKALTQKPLLLLQTK